MRYTSAHTPGHSHGGSGWSSGTSNLTRILGGLLLFVLVHNSVHAVQSVTLAWDRNQESDIAGYRRYYGQASGTYTSMADVGNVATVSVSGLLEGSTYYFAVTAYNTAGLESTPSNEVTYTVPPTSGVPTITLTSPTNGASYAAPASINLAASVTANGHTITKVQFYNGATLVGEDASTPYALTWSNVSAGSYSLTARAVYDAGSTVNSATVSINVTGLPAPWQTVDIGSVSAVGSANVSSGTYTIKGAGNISSTADNFRLVYQPLSGDGEVKVRLSSVGNTGSAGRIGVMIRESLTSGSRYAFMGISPDGTFRWQRRSTTAGSTRSTLSTIGTPPNVWVRLVRTGNTLYGYRSTDGTTWTLVNSRSISMATNIYIALAVASGSPSTLNTATFTNVTVIP